MPAYENITYTDGAINQPSLVCAQWEPAPLLKFEGTVTDSVKVVMGGCGECLMSREEIAALAALFPVQDSRIGRRG